MVLEILRPGRNTRKARARYGVGHLQRSGHDWFCAQKKQARLEEFCQANPPFVVAVKKIANIADLGFLGSAGGRHMPEP